MFRNIKELTTEELQKEIQAIELFEQEIGKVNVENMLNKSIDTSFLGPMQCTITPNGQLFRTDHQGFLPKMMEEMYEDRKKFKKLMLKAKQDYENETDDSKKYAIEKNIAKYIILLTHLKSFFHPNNSPKRNVIIELEKNLTARNTGFQHR